MTRGNQKFFRCKHCGNLVGLIHNAGVQMFCCGEPMEELTANTTDAAQEKHVPVVKRDGNRLTISVGETLHPMQDDHWIEWIYLQTSRGGQRKAMNPGEQPVMEFYLAEDEEPIAAFAYCNLHSLWKAEL